ncbi:MAG: putative branched-chain amino acid-binding protein, partial [Rhodoferax sp.]|nr:putative branched-chain amino acid-binding protein [Rhodoferax sp.]
MQNIFGTTLRKAARLTAALAAATLLAGAAQAQTLKIGVIAPLTGGGAPWGLAAAEAPRILADEVNAKGGLEVGGKKYKIEVVAYDDQYKTAEAVAAYNRLVNQDGVKYMIILSSAATMALKQNVEDDKVVALTA